LMGGRFSRVQYREQDAAVLSHLVLLTQVWWIAFLSTRLRRLSFNFCLTLQQFEDLVGLRNNPLFKTMLQRWFTTFQNTHSSTIVNGLEFLTALALTTADGKLEEKAGAVFDIFDFDDSGAITRDELGILIKSAVRGLSKATKGLGPKLAALCPMSEVAELTRQCFVHCDLDDEQDLPRSRFILWVKQTPKIVNLLRCFVQREYLSEDEAAVMIQRCGRGMLARREAAERRLEIQLELFYSPERLSSLRLYVRPDEIVGRIAVLEFGQEDVAFDADALDASELIGRLMESLVSLVKDAQSAGAVGVVIIFDFLGADAFALEVDEEDGDADSFKIPAVMIHTWKATLVDFVKKRGRAGKAAQKAGAKAVVVAQTRVDPDPVRLEMSVFGAGEGEKAPSTAGVKIPVTSIPYTVGARMKARLEGVEAEDSQCRIALIGSGTLYAWGLAENGRLGLPKGDIENEKLFQSGYDGARQKSYQFVQELEVVSALISKEIAHISCGEDYSAAVSSDGTLYCWGSGRDGKLGTGSMDDEDIPVAIDALSSVKVARVECGVSQTVRATSTTSTWDGFSLQNVTDIVIYVSTAGSHAKPFTTEQIAYNPNARCSRTTLCSI
ncbi:hypothetical protein JG688_00013549, partial [Phytophthora aleatoria]